MGTDSEDYIRVCGLVVKQRRGREQLVRTDAASVAEARRRLEALETAWRGRVERMAELL